MNSTPPEPEQSIDGSASPPRSRGWARWLALALALLLHAGFGYVLFIVAVIVVLGTGERLAPGESFEFVDSLFWLIVALWAAALVAVVLLWRRTPWLAPLVPPVWLAVGWATLFYGAMRFEAPPVPDACDLTSRLQVFEAATATPATGSPPSVRWCVDLGGDGVAGSNVAIAGERVVLARARGGVETLALGNGRRLWLAPLGRPTGALAVASDTIFAGADDGLLALDLATGQERWRLALDGGVLLPPLITADTVFVAEAGGTLHAVESATGATRWRFATGSPLIAVPPLAAGDLLLVVGRSPERPDGNLVAVEVATGEERWQALIGSHGQTTVAVAGDVVYAALADPAQQEGPTLAALDLASGRVRWRHPLAGARERITSGPALGAGLVLAGVGRRTPNDEVWADGALLAVDARTGDLRWRVDTWAPVEVTPTVVGDIAYALDRSSGTLWSVGTADGAVRWHRPQASGNGLRGNDDPVRVDDGTIYMRRQGALDVLDAATGELRWRFVSGAAIDGEFAVAPGGIVVGGDGVYALAGPAATGP